MNQMQCKLPAKTPGDQFGITYLEINDPLCHAQPPLLSWGGCPGTRMPRARLSTSSLGDRDAAKHPKGLLLPLESGGAVLPAGTATGRCELAGVTAL